ncbi:MAG: SpoIIE family protein phosphatase [Blastocatellia bacterium]|nr:SpoIIE family protein phosphatase [Blastocatellia bacterium]
MLPRRLLVKKTRWIWIALLALSPVAYALSVSLLLKYDPNANLQLAIDRAGAMEIAAKYAATRGINVSGWTGLCRVRPQNNLRFYYRMKSGADRERALLMAPELTIQVLFRAPDRSENIEVELGKDGRPLGHTHRVRGDRNAAEIAEPEARARAQQAMQDRLRGFAINATPELTLREETEEGVVTRRYSWQVPLDSLPELSLRGLISIRGDQLMSDRLNAEIDREFARNYLRTNSVFRIISGIIYGIAILLALIFGIYRFVQRVKQKEISYGRIVVLSLVVATGFSFFILFTDVAVYDVASQPGFPAPDWVILFSACMLYAVLGLFFGLAYGSGEGDIRESYPGKLTSLDAFLTGRIFSKNVAIAIVWGWVIGSWISLSSLLVLLPWQGRPGMGEDLAPVDPWLGRVVWASPLTGWLLDAILITVVGLLLPLPFLRRRLRSEKAILPVLAVFVWIACSAPYLTFRPWYVIGLMAIGRMALFLVAFFYFDLFTAMVSLATPTLVTFAVSMVVQPAPSIREAGITALVIAGISLVLAIVYSFRGRHYREDEVAPVYAKNIAERLSMQVEVSTAREAQKRLMPETLPRSAAFDIAAACLPAHEVGGDFYDLYELDSGKIGVLVAEGGGKGLGSALSIAFAKGFLLPKILPGGRSERGADDSPTEVVRGLQDRLLSLLADEAGVGLAYAVIDPTDGTLRYARVGSHPVVIVAGEAGASPASQPEERTIKFKSTRSKAGSSDIVVTEGRLSLKEGESVIFYTDGIAKAWNRNGAPPKGEFDQILADRLSAKNLQQALDKGVRECAKRARKSGAEDDLTAVIIRLKPTPEEEVA